MVRLNAEYLSLESYSKARRGRSQYFHSCISFHWFLVPHFYRTFPGSTTDWKGRKSVEPVVSDPYPSSAKVGCHEQFYDIINQKSCKFREQLPSNVFISTGESNAIQEELYCLSLTLLKQLREPPLCWNAAEGYSPIPFVWLKSPFTTLQVLPSPLQIPQRSSLAAEPMIPSQPIF